MRESERTPLWNRQFPFGRAFALAPVLPVVFVFAPAQRGFLRGAGVPTDGLCPARGERAGMVEVRAVVAVFDGDGLHDLDSGRQTGTCHDAAQGW